jgi:hypothetical protein
VVSYAVFERIHWLLVAGFDVFGNVGHQLNTRLYMDFLRMEGETSFVAFLPEADAERELLSWYRDAESSVADYLEVLRAIGQRPTGIRYTTDDPKHELFVALRDHIGADVAGEDPIVGRVDRRDDSPGMRGLRRLASLEGAALEPLPEQSILQVQGRTDASGQTGPAVYTLLVNRAHTNVSSLFGESERLRPEEYTVSVLPGVVGSYPNAFLRLREHELDDFAETIGAIGSESDYASLLDRFGVRRTSEGFWAFSDWLHEWYRDAAPIESGWLDFNRFENR